MRFHQPALTWLLVALLSAGALMPAPQAHPAGCHQRAPRLPGRAPADYGCCQAGHDVPMLFPTRSLPTIMTGASPLTNFGLTAVLIMADGAKRIILTSAAPPGTSPLRV
ncbi:MAG TPA: hypothetical protein VEI01_06960 [Terriglobales bacterium]|nr:hypothetical protein [Terriglobales bacterium]